MRSQLVVVALGAGAILAVAAGGLEAGLRGGLLVAVVGGAWLVIATVDVVAFWRARHERQTEVPKQEWMLRLIEGSVKEWIWRLVEMLATVRRTITPGRAAPRRRPARPPLPRAPMELQTATSLPPESTRLPLRVRSSPVPVEPPAPEPRQWNIWELERLARARGEPAELSIDQAALLLHLRSYANAEGALPIEFDALVRESFNNLLEVARS